jgi:hypothetical protein
VPIATAHRVFDAQGNVVDGKYAARLDQLGRLVVDTAQRWQPLELELEA